MNGYEIVSESIRTGQVVTEVRETDQRGRINRFFARFSTKMSGEVRKTINRFKIWLWPTYLWSDAVNICKILARSGTRQNEQMYRDYAKLMMHASDGRFRSGKEFNTAKQQIMAKYKLRKQRLLDHVEEV